MRCGKFFIVGNLVFVVFVCLLNLLISLRFFVVGRGGGSELILVSFDVELLIWEFSWKEIIFEFGVLGVDLSVCLCFFGGVFIGVDWLIGEFIWCIWGEGVVRFCEVIIWWFIVEGCWVCGMLWFCVVGVKWVWEKLVCCCCCCW